MNLEIQKVNIKEIFHPVSKLDDTRLVPFFAKDVIAGLELTIPALWWHIGGSIPFWIDVQTQVADDRSRVLHSLRAESDASLLRQRGLVEGHQRRALFFTWEEGNFSEEALRIVQRLRLHTMQEGGRLEHEPNWDQLKKGCLEFTPRPLVEKSAHLTQVRWRFILAD